uniref:Uncharacterized protein n=1 Tax=Anguilla anguilla TaxID=7936 RepID=A0A0E9S956_ANGAN
MNRRKSVAFPASQNGLLRDVGYHMIRFFVCLSVQRNNK